MACGGWCDSEYLLRIKAHQIGRSPLPCGRGEWPKRWVACAIASLRQFFKESIVHCFTCGNACPWPYARETLGRVFCTRSCWETFKERGTHEHHQSSGGSPPEEKSRAGATPTAFGSLLQEALQGDAAKSPG